MTEQTTSQIGGIAADALKSAITRIENLEQEKKGLSDDVREVYNQAKSQGFEPKIIREIVRLRRMDKSEREEKDQIMELYLAAIGMA